MYFLTWPDKIFLTWRAKNWKIWDFKGKFSNAKPKPKMADPIRPGPGNKIWPAQPGSKYFDPNPSLGRTLNPILSFCKNILSIYTPCEFSSLKAHYLARNYFLLLWQPWVKGWLVVPAGYQTRGSIPGPSDSQPDALSKFLSSWYLDFWAHNCSFFSFFL